MNQIQLIEKDQKNVIYRNMIELMELLEDFKIDHYERVRIFNNLIELVDDPESIDGFVKEQIMGIKDQDQKMNEKLEVLMEERQRLRNQIMKESGYS